MCYRGCNQNYGAPAMIHRSSFRKVAAAPSYVSQTTVGAAVLCPSPDFSIVPALPSSLYSHALSTTDMGASRAFHSLWNAAIRLSSCSCSAVQLSAQVRRGVRRRVQGQAHPAHRRSGGRRSPPARPRGTGRRSYALRASWSGGRAAKVPFLPWAPMRLVV